MGCLHKIRSGLSAFYPQMCLSKDDFKKLPNAARMIHYRLSDVTLQMRKYKSSVLVRLSCTLTVSLGLQ